MQESEHSDDAVLMDEGHIFEPQDPEFADSNEPDWDDPKVAEYWDKVANGVIKLGRDFRQ